MPAVYLDRDTYSQFQSDAIDQQAQRVKEDIGAAPPLPSTEAPTPPPEPAPAFQPPTPSDTLTQPVPRAVPGPPPLSDLMATAGLGASPSSAVDGAVPSAAGAAPTGGPPPLQNLLQMAGLSDTGVAGSSPQVAAVGVQAPPSGPPPLQNLLQMAGLADVGGAVSRGAQAVGGAVQDVASRAGAALSGGVSQFGLGLSTADAYAFCGPAAAISFAQQFGRNPTADEARQLAVSVGWTPNQGMAGVDSERALLGKMGISTKLERGVDWNHVTQDALNGNPVILDTPGHYYFVDGAQQNQDGTTQYHVGQSGLALKGGAEWMTRDQLQNMAAAGTVRAALYADNPQSPHPSVATPTSSTQTTAGLSGGGGLSGQVGDRGQQILSAGAQAASWLGDQGQKALQAVMVTEGGLNNARGDNGQSVGPLQFYAGGQLANLAQQMGMGIDAAKTWVEQNPVAAVQWAIGTPDRPGYLGAAIQRGLQQGLQGADLATYAQRTGQVSVSPERAGQNFQAMFGGGQNVIAGAAGAAGNVFSNLAQTGGQLAQQGQNLLTNLTQPLGESPTAPIEREANQRMANLQDTLNTTLQANQQAQDQRSVQASALGGGLAGRSMVNVTDTGAGGQTSEQIAGGQTMAQAEPPKPLWQSIGDTIGSAISQGLQPLVQAFQGSPTSAPEGGGYGAVPAGGVNPLEGLAQAAQTGQGNLVARGVQLDQTGAPTLPPPAEELGQQAVGAVTEAAQNPYLPTTLTNTGLQAVGQNVVAPVLGAIAQPGGILAGPRAAAAGALESAAANVPENVPVVAGALRGVAGMVGGPTILDAAQTASDLEQKYGGGIGPDGKFRAADYRNITPEDQEALHNAIMAVGGVTLPPATGEGGGTAAERVAAEAVGAPEAGAGARAVAETPPAGAATGAEAPRAGAEPAAAVTPRAAPESQAASMLQDMLNDAQRRGGDPETIASMQSRLDDLRAATPRPVGTEPPPPGGIPPGQQPLPGMGAPTPIHPRIQQLLGNQPARAQIAQDGLNDLQASRADPATVARYFAAIERQAGLPSGVDANAWFRALRNGSMAGGLQTLGHVALNIPMQVLWSIAREPVAAVLRGQPEQIPASLVGLFKGHAAAAEDALQQLRYGITAADAAAGGTTRTVVDANGVPRSVMTAANTALPPTIGLRTENPALQTVANVLSGTVGTHGAAQTYVQRLGFYQKATELAWSQAKSEGLTGSEFGARVGDILSNITDPQHASMLTEANNYGDRMALRGAQGTIGSLFKRVAGAGPIGNLIIPFESIANKVLTGGVEATPGLGALGAGVDVARARFGAGPYAPGARDVVRGAVTPLSERLANQILGVGVTAMGMGLAAQGILKGAGPSNPQERATALDKGEQFDGINIGQVFVPGHMLGRLWYPLALAANVVEAQKYAKQGATPEQMIQDAAQRTAQFFENETFLRSFGDLTRAIKDPSGKQMENFVASQLGSLIPQEAMLRDIGSAFDPTARAPAPGTNPLEAIGNRIEAQLPGIRQQQPPRINATTGRDTPNRSGILGSFLHPKLADDPVATEALRLQMAGQKVSGLTAPKETYLGGQQTPGQLTAAQRATGAAVQLYATNILNNPKYAALTDTQKADALSRALSLAGKVANVQLGGTVSRGPHEAALLQWAQTPQYSGVSSRLQPEQIAMANLQIEEAKAKLSQYAKQYGGTGESRLARDDPTAYRLSQRDRLDKEVLDRIRARIDKATGGALLQTEEKAAAGGLVGAGSTVLGP